MADETAFGVQRGDIWQLGRHRLMCGDAACASDVAALMAGDDARFVFTSPPYGQQRDYTKRLTDWRGLLRAAFSNLPRNQNTQVVVNLGIWHEKGEWSLDWVDWIRDMGALGYKRSAWMVWDKLNGAPILPSMGRPNPAHEFLFVFCAKASPLRKTVPCKWHGKDALRKPGLKSARGRDGAVNTHVGKGIQAFKVIDSVVRHPPEKANRTGHPAVFPVGLPLSLIPAYTDAGDVVVDVFAGTCSTLIAAERTGRTGYGMEIAPEYCEIALRRWSKAYPDQLPVRC